MNLNIAAKSLIIANHPIAKHNLAILRDKNTSSELFRNATRRLAQILFTYATDNLPLRKTFISTPLIDTEADVIDKDSEIIIAPILRAGLIFSEVASETLPDARVHHIGLYRDEKTLKPVAYYNNLPKTFINPANTFVYILDPMLATGGSAIEAIKLFISLSIPENNIRFISLISAPEGIQKLQSIYPEVSIITACIDKYLNEIGYILPGLGDAGDRTFNTTY